eukprot:scaffold24574_cov157-Cylindrotheca_fusiformis.AAC.1
MMITENPSSWDQVSEGYSSTITGPFRRFNQEIISSSFPTAAAANGRCLDLCCGAGAAALALSKTFERIDAIDFSEGMIRQTEANLKVEGITNVFPQQGDAKKIEDLFPKESIDVVWSSFGIFMIPEYKEVMKSVASILKPGGTFLFTSFPKRMESPFHKMLFEACSAAMESSKEDSDNPVDSSIEGYSEEGLHNPEYIQSLLKSIGFCNIKTEMRNIPIQLANVETFWKECATSNIQFIPMRESMGEAGWQEFSQKAQEYLKAKMSFPCELNMIAIVSRGEKA